MLLSWHDYRYYPYERELALLELRSLFDDPIVGETEQGVELSANGGSLPAKTGSRLTYFAEVQHGRDRFPTLQSQLEATARSGRKRQATRYSVHGLHEYKGKFNPQVVRALLNIFDIGPDQSVLDPFCGSGTTLVECSHMGVISHGIDVNPLAVYVSNAKLKALGTPITKLQASLHLLTTKLNTDARGLSDSLDDSERTAYLRSWFRSDILQAIERLRILICELARDQAPIFLTIASNLLRAYSQQDPRDLRIRRRRSPLPTNSFYDAFSRGASIALERIEAAQSVLGTRFPANRAELGDIVGCTADQFSAQFDSAITSPPYAMALPYIDTQRLSLVWLGLVSPDRIRALEAELIGSREFRGVDRSELRATMASNTAGLPQAEAMFCRQLHGALDSRDGFRRQAVPILLYRYFVAMQGSFESILRLLRPGAPFALIVGRNHSTIGGDRYDIDTPTHLANLASNVGWLVSDMLPLQTYRRYGYHVNNAVASEVLVVLKKP